MMLYSCTHGNSGRQRVNHVYHTVDLTCKPCRRNTDLAVLVWDFLKLGGKSVVFPLSILLFSFSFLVYQRRTSCDFTLAF